MLENYKEVVEALEDANDEIISHRVNDVLRFLTAISVIVLPLTLIASVWEMNVGVPGEGDPRTSTSSSAPCSSSLLGMVAYCRRRRVALAATTPVPIPDTAMSLIAYLRRFGRSTPPRQSAQERARARTIPGRTSGTPASCICAGSSS